MTIHEALAWGTEQLTDISQTARLDAELLLLHSLGQDERTWLVAHAQDEISDDALGMFKSYISRRANHEPVAYITGHKEFYGLDFAVDNRVLVPRPETEIVVEQALLHIKRCCVPDTAVRDTQISLVDVGTGSGCIPVSILKNTPVSVAFGIDVSEDALDVAQHNATLHGVEDRITFLQGNLLEPILQSLPAGRHGEILNLKSDIIVTANLPYISSEEYANPHHPDIHHEPRTALEGGTTGVEPFTELFQQIKDADHTTKAHSLTIITEHGPDQAELITNAATELFGDSHIETKKDHADHDRVTVVNITR